MCREGKPACQEDNKQHWAKAGPRAAGGEVVVRQMGGGLWWGKGQGHSRPKAYEHWVMMNEQIHG